MMRKRSGRHLMGWCLPAMVMFGVSAGAAAQDHHDHAAASTEAPSADAHTMRWSDPAAWPDGRVPGEGDAVMIARDMDLVLDIDPPALRSLTIDGKLTFSNDLDITLATDWIYLRRGELHIGSEASPHTRQATITLTDTVPGEDINTMGDRGIMLMSGTLSLHGDRTHTWTKLAGTAAAGTTTIEVLDGLDRL